jgi:hypothetical protein
VCGTGGEMCGTGGEIEGGLGLTSGSGPPTTMIIFAFAL